MYLKFASCALVLLALGGTTHASLDFDFSGTFTKDNDVVLLNFTVGNTSTVTVFSSSWIDFNSTGVPVHGFDPILAIWDSSGNLIEEQDDGGLTGQQLSNGVFYDYGVWDSYYQVTLGPGTYTASIAQFDNFAVSSSLSDGFRYDSAPHFTFDENYGPQANFNGVSNDLDARTGDWSFHILNVDDASGPGNPTVPEPATLAVWSILGLVGVGTAKLQTRARKPTGK